MLSAIDAPKSKSITIAFMALKAMVLGYIGTTAFNKVDKSACLPNSQEMQNLLKMFFLLGILLDVLALLYFYITSRFSRLEYYVFYIYHVLISMFALVLGVMAREKNKECSVVSTFLATSVFINFVFIVSAFAVMWSNLYFALKFAHLGSNIVWFFMWVEGASCHHFIISLIGFTHGFISIIGFLSFVVLKVLKKSQNTAQCWRNIHILSLIAMLFCYLVLVMGLPTDHGCPQTFIFFQTYKVFGLFELLSPTLLLIFLNTEMGDPREIVIKKDAHIFIRNRQNMNFEVDDVN